MQKAAEIATIKSGGKGFLRRETSNKAFSNTGNDDTEGATTTSSTRINNGAGPSPHVTPTASNGYTGWLGAFLSGFNRAFSHPTGSTDGTTVMLEDSRLKKSLHKPYLLFKGFSADGVSNAIDPMYLGEAEFDELMHPYENVLGIAKGDDNNHRTANDNHKRNNDHENSVVVVEKVAEPVNSSGASWKASSKSEASSNGITTTWGDKKLANGVERLFNSIASPTITQLQWMSSALKSLMIGGNK